MPIGKSGALKNCQATVYNQEGGKYIYELESYGCQVVDSRIVKYNNFITSQGPESAIDTAFELLRKLSNHTNAEKIKAAMGF